MTKMSQMKVKIENKKNCRKLIKIEVEPEKVKSALEEIYKTIGRDAQIPGFRKGKAPRDILETRYNETANSEAIRRLVWEAYRDAVKANDIKPVSYPIIEDVKLDQNGPLCFTVKVDIEPVIALKPYINIKIKKSAADVTEEDIKKALEAVRESAGRFEPVEGRPIKMGDYVVCDYDCLVEGKSIDQQKNVSLHIKEDSGLSQITKALAGSNKGETKEVALELPKDYKQNEYGGKKGVYKITVNEIKQKILPALDDEMAKQIGSFQNLQQLKDRLRQQLQLDKRQQQRFDMENQLFDFLLKANQFEVPESTVERQLQVMVNDAKTRLIYQGYKKEEVESQQDKLKQTLADNAKRQVRIFFMLGAIAEKENINVTGEELNRQIEQMSKAAKQDVEKFKQTLQDKEMVDNLKQQMLHDKAIGFLLEKARISEK